MNLRILHVAPTFWPATYWGGPIFSTRAICDGIASRPEFELRVLTTDSAGPHGKQVGPRAKEDDHYVVIRTQRRAGASISPGLLARLHGEVRRADVVHLTATYSFPTLPTLAAARLFGRPVVWSPRGALQATADWADAPRRTLKKHFESLAQGLRPAATVLHVTSAEEAMRSIVNLPGIETALIPNSVDVPQSLPLRIWRPDGRLRLLFLGRVHPKKGINLLMDAMARLPDWVSLDIYGDGEVEHLATVRSQILPGARVRMHGPANEIEKRAAFLAADLFVLPSWSENFGIAVAEALAHGVPVLTTTRTPWRDLGLRGCGASIDPEADDLAAAIDAMSRRDLAAMGLRGRDWMQKDYSTTSMCDAFAALYIRLAGRR